MNKPMEYHVKKALDTIQKRLADYACDLNYAGLSPEAIHAAKVRVIDTMGALIGAFFAEPCRITRDLAAHLPPRAELNCTIRFANGSSGNVALKSRIDTPREMAWYRGGGILNYVLEKVRGSGHGTA